MSKADKFFQFPIAALQMGAPLTEVDEYESKKRLLAIFDYCIVETGTHFVNKSSQQAISGLMERYTGLYSLDADDSDTDHQACICGAATLNERVHSPIPNRANHEAIERLSNASGKKLRLRTDIFWDAYDNGWTWRDFAILCAVYCGIGAYPFAKLSRGYLAILALGYASKAELIKSGYSGFRMSDRNIGYTVESLHKRKFFAKVSPNYRHNYYSKSMDDLALANKLLKPDGEQRPSPKQVTQAIRAKLSEREKQKSAAAKKASNNTPDTIQYLNELAANESRKAL